MRLISSQEIALVSGGEWDGSGCDNWQLDDDSVPYCAPTVNVSGSLAESLSESRTWGAIAAIAALAVGVISAPVAVVGAAVAFGVVGTLAILGVESTS
jgi:hypothetical protein